MDKNQPVLTPMMTSVLAILFIIVVEIVLVSIKLRQPWTGISLSPVGQSFRVSALADDSPALGILAVGNVLTGLETQDAVIHFPANLLNGALSLGSYQELNAHLQLQADLEQALAPAVPVRFRSVEGQTFVVTPNPHTRWYDIPALFWWIGLLNVMSLLVAVVVWMYKPWTLESSSLLVASVSYFCANSIFRLWYTSEFYVPTVLAGLLVRLEATLFYTLMASLFVILCYYPTRLAPRYLLPWSIAVLVMLSLNYSWQWVSLPIHIYFFPIVPFISYATWLFYRHWKLTHGDPVSRATLLVLQLSVLLPTWFIVMFHALPIVLGFPPIIGDVANRLLLLGIFVGWAVGILRFRLFEFEYWWFKTLLWIMGGSLVVVLDVLLAAVFQVSQAYMLGLALLVAGFLYFPLRQWLLETLLPMEHQSLQASLPAFSRSMADASSRQDFEVRWQTILQQHFRPLHMVEVADPSVTVALADNGLSLMVPSLVNHHAYQLSGKQMAARLFNLSDVRHMNSLLTIARMACNASEVRQQAITEERQRIMHDLHDSVGAKLLTLSHKLPDPSLRDDVRQALVILRETVRLSQKVNPMKLVDNIADWRAEITGRAEAAGTALRWQQDERLNTCQLCPRKILHLSQILREAVSNALKHAEPETLEVGFALSNCKLHLIVANDGKISPPEHWQAGTGVNGIRHRVEALGGEVGFYSSDPPQSRITVHIAVPLQA